MAEQLKAVRARLYPPQTRWQAPEPPQPAPTPSWHVGQPPASPMPPDVGLHVVRNDEIADFEDQRHLRHRID